MIDQSVPFGKNILLKVLNLFSQSIHFFFHFSSEVKYKVYTNMRRAKTTEGKRSRKSSTVCLLVTYVDFSFLWLQPKQFNCLKKRKKPILAERWVNWYNSGKQLLQYSQTRNLLTGVRRRIAIVTCCARDQLRQISTATCKNIAEHSIENWLKSRTIGPVLYVPQRFSGPWSVCMAMAKYF